MCEISEYLDNISVYSERDKKETTKLAKIKLSEFWKIPRYDIEKQTKFFETLLTNKRKS